MKRAIWCSMLGLVAAAAMVRADETSDAKAIVGKAISAVGGEDKLLRLFRWKEQYFVGDGKTGTIREAIIQLPDHWWQGSTDIAKENPDRLDKTHLVEAWTLVALTDKQAALKPLPAIKIHDRPAVGVHVSRKDRADLDMYFDAESGLLMRIDWRTFRITFSDWKEADGVKYPAKAFVHHPDGRLHLRTEFLELERLKSLPEGLK